jgi:hypothetical protein
MQNFIRFIKKFIGKNNRNDEQPNVIYVSKNIDVQPIDKYKELL